MTKKQMLAASVMINAFYDVLFAVILGHPLQFLALFIFNVPFCYLIGYFCFIYEGKKDAVSEESKG